MLRILPVWDASWHVAVMVLTHEYADIGESFRPVAHPYIIRSAYGISWLYIAGDVANEGYKAYMRNQRLVNPEMAEEPVHGNIVDKAKSLKDTFTNTAHVRAGTSSGNGSSLTGGEIVPGSVPAIEDWRAVAAQRAVFQSVASMGLPALTIHSIVRYSGRAMKNIKNVRLRTWGPIGVSPTSSRLWMKALLMRLQLGIATVPALPFIFDEPIEHLTEQVFYHAFKLIGGPQAVEGRPVTGKKELRKVESHVGESPKPEL
jgi:fission process protein 1